MNKKPVPASPIKNSKMKYLVIDVETFRSPDNPRVVHDLGMAIVDNTGKIYESVSLLDNKYWGNGKNISGLLFNRFTEKHLVQYSKGIRYGRFTFSDNIPAEIERLVKTWKPKYVCAYNAGYDLDAIKRTYGETVLDSMEFIDIWHFSNQVITSSKKYILWAWLNKVTTDNGNLSTTAESVYGYISNNPRFEEEHTGHEDVLIEIKILVECLKKKQKLEKNVKGNWYTPQPKWQAFISKKGA